MTRVDIHPPLFTLGIFGFGGPAVLGGPLLDEEALVRFLFPM